MKPFADAARDALRMMREEGLSPRAIYVGSRDWDEVGDTVEFDGVPIRPSRSRSGLSVIYAKYGISRYIRRGSVGPRNRELVRAAIGARFPVVEPRRQAPPAKPSQPAPRRAERAWCDQCQRRVAAAVAAACTSPFCKVRPPP